jgi:hypothetical protein
LCIKNSRKEAREFVDDTKFDFAEEVAARSFVTKEVECGVASLALALTHRSLHADRTQA